MKPSLTMQSVSSSRTKRHFWFNLFLLLAFVSSAITGVNLHIAGQGINLEVLHRWSIAHIILSFLWLILCVIHIKKHSNWYRMLVRKGSLAKRRITLILSVVFLLTVITAIISMVSTHEVNSAVGLWHFRLGFLLIIIALFHILRRRKNIIPK